MASPATPPDEESTPTSPAPPARSADPAADGAHPPAPERRRITRRTWWELFLQFGAVLFGVIGATIITDWRESQATAELRQRALQSIANEIAYNRNALQVRRDYYHVVVREIDALFQEALAQAKTDHAAEHGVEVAALGYRDVAHRIKISYHDLTQFNGFNPVLLRQSSFDVSQHSQAFGGLDYSLAERIAHVYAVQEWTKGGVSKWMDYIVQRDINSLPMQELGGILQDWVVMSDRLLATYEDIAGDLPPPNAATTDLDLS